MYEQGGVQYTTKSINDALGDTSVLLGLYAEMHNLPPLVSVLRDFLGFDETQDIAQEMAGVFGVDTSAINSRLVVITPNSKYLRKLANPA